MKIYTGNPSGCTAKIREMEKRGIGVMLSSPRVGPELLRLPVAIDNGAFAAWERGYPFQEGHFLETVDKAFRKGVKPDFIVCPDIVAGGRESLAFSVDWAMDRMQGAPRLALAVQDGMEPSDITSFERAPFRFIFVGGTLAWKWRTAEQWCDFAHKYDMQCHIGRCGTENDLRRALRLGADSVDSTSLVRHDSWHHVDAIAAPDAQGELCFAENVRTT